MLSKLPYELQDLVGEFYQEREKCIFNYICPYEFQFSFKPPNQDDLVDFIHTKLRDFFNFTRWGQDRVFCPQEDPFGIDIYIDTDILVNINENETRTRYFYVTSRKKEDYVGEHENLHEGSSFLVLLSLNDKWSIFVYETCPIWREKFYIDHSDINGA